MKERWSLSSDHSPTVNTFVKQLARSKEWVTRLYNQGGVSVSASCEMMPQGKTMRMGSGTRSVEEVRV